MTGPTDPSGRPIGQRYERIDVLGSGGQGVVYRAFDRWMQRDVAIKVLSSEAARQPHMTERLMREQRALSALEGTAAVEVLDIYRAEGGELCLVMELLLGENLDEHLAALEGHGELMPLPRVAELVEPIVDTLEVAHKAGIVHRDLKPANIFLLLDGGVRLLDFGMARLKKAAPLTAAGTVMGSPSFMAPEAWGGRSELVDHRADVYSLGVILFRMLSGDLPFSGLTLYEKFLGSTKAPRPSLVKKRPDLPAEADEWVALALAVDREQRFRNVRALWNAFLSTFDVASPKRSPSFWSKAKRGVQKFAGIEPSSSRSADPPRSTDAGTPREPSFVSAALARSASRVPEPTPPAITVPTGPAHEPAPPAEKTIELTELDFSHSPPSRARSVETTLELGSSEFAAVEDTLPAETPAADARRAPPPPRRRP